MFNIGFGEVLVIALIALLVFGPNRLPEIMRSLGKAVRQFQSESQRAATMLKEGLEGRPEPPAGVIDRPDAALAAAAEREQVPDTHDHNYVPPPEAIEPAAREYEDT